MSDYLGHFSLLSSEMEPLYCSGYWKESHPPVQLKVLFFIRCFKLQLLESLKQNKEGVRIGMNPSL